jgi:HSP20 family protein
MAIAYNPFREMDRLFSLMNRQVGSDTLAMPMDLFRVGDVVTVRIDLPGVDPESIDIDVEDRTLTVRAERQTEEIDTTEENNGWVVRERTVGTFARQIPLGNGLDMASIEASYDDGVLELTIPLAEEAKPRKVTVKTKKQAIDAE